MSPVASPSAEILTGVLEPRAEQSALDFFAAVASVEAAFASDSNETKLRFLAEYFLQLENKAT